MPLKPGRPKLKTEYARGVLIGARFDPVEAKQVQEAAKRARMKKSEWIRRILLDAAKSKECKGQIMKIKLTVGEINELRRTPKSSASRGGFQNYLVQLQDRVNSESGELLLDSTDLGKLQRYAFGYKTGGYQTRLKRIFARNLGNDLAGTIAA